jgi:hypothetical protein
MSTADPEGAAHGIDGEKDDLRDALVCALKLPVALTRAALNADSP